MDVTDGERQRAFLAVLREGSLSGTAKPRILSALFGHPLETWVVTHEDMRSVARMRTTFDHLVAGLTAYLA